MSPTRLSRTSRTPPGAWGPPCTAFTALPTQTRLTTEAGVLGGCVAGLPVSTYSHHIHTSSPSSNRGITGRASPASPTVPNYGDCGSRCRARHECHQGAVILTQQNRRPTTAGQALFQSDLRTMPPSGAQVLLTLLDSKLRPDRERARTRRDVHRNLRDSSKRAYRVCSR